MDKEDEKTTWPEAQAFAVGEFRPEDAEGIVRLFRSVYGEGYPIRTFYDPEAVTAANLEGRIYSIVARTPSGDVIGVNHLLQTAPSRGVYENGAGLIRKDYRNSGAMTATLDYLYEKFVPRHPNIEEIFGEPVCNHVAMQKGGERFRFVETGLEVALMPAEAYSQEKSAPGRVATLTCFRCYVPKPHRIHIPSAYEEILRRIYARLDDNRDIAQAGESLPNIETRADMELFDFARVARIAVPQLGRDFTARLSELEERARSGNVVVFQVWLNLTEPWVGEAVDILRERGYFFGAAMPRWFDGDGLLLQKLDCPPDFENIILLSDFSKELLDYIRKDWERTGAGKNKK